MTSQATTFRFVRSGSFAAGGIIACVGALAQSQPTSPAASAPVAPPATSTPAASVPAGLVEVFPGVRVDRVNGLVEFDATVPIDAHEAGKKVFLEAVACVRDTKEHESLVMTLAKPSQVHAALLLAGFKPGKPVAWRDEKGKQVAEPPTGQAVKIELRWKDAAGVEKTQSPLEWVKNDKAGKPPSAAAGFVFAGSVMIPMKNGGERYDADAAGTLIGLASFGSETIAWTSVFSPESSVDEPVWIADSAAVPKVGTEVVVRLSMVKEKQEDSKPTESPATK